MRTKINWELLAKSFAHECTPEEEAALEAWCSADKDNAILMEQARAIWEQSHGIADIDAAWKRLSLRIEQEKKIKPLPDHSHIHDTRSRLRLQPSSGHLLRIAAVIAGIVLISLLVRELSRDTTPVQTIQQVKVFAAQSGQRVTVDLTDGTRLRLNAESKLTLAADFGTNSREVFLDGEAYFDVAPDSTRPFLVHARDSRIRVLGTSFNVRAYRDEKEVQVIVADGTVSMGSESDALPDTVILKRGYMGIQAGSRIASVGKVDLDRHLAWLDGRLVFEDAQFSEVARELERWYDIEVELTISPTRVDRLNANFERDVPLREILNSIASTLNLGYESNNNGVIFYPLQP